MRRPLSFSAFTTAALGLTLAFAGAAPAATPDPGPAQRVLVAVRGSDAVDDVAALADRVGADVTAEVPAAATVAVEATASQLARLADSDDVIAVTPDFPLQASLAQRE